MANINIKLSQNVVDQQMGSGQHNTPLDGSIGSVIDAVAIVDYYLGTAYPSATVWTQVGSTLNMTFADGATVTYTGVVFDTLGADHGGVTMTGYEFHKDGMLLAAHKGTLHYNYTMTAAATGSTLAFQSSAKGLSLNSFHLATLVPPSSSEYDPAMGNIDFVIGGAINITQTGDLSGNITKITASADKFILSEVIEGNFQVTGNVLTAGQQLTNTVASGTLTGYNDQYRDGSYLTVSNISTHISASQAFDTTMFSDAARFSGNDTINIELPGHLYADFMMASGDGNDQISIKGGGGRLNVNAGSGNDRITVLGDAHQVDGGAGFDILSLTGARSAYTVAHTAAGFTVTDGAGAASALVNVERIAFADTALALDIQGTGGQVYRLYQAAFNRAPDSGGLGFQMWAMDTVGWSLNQVAQGFIDSPEFTKTYGSLSNRDFVTQMYANVLHRAPDAGGLKFHVDLLDAGTITRAQDLAGFSESPENQAALVGVIGNGFVYTPYAG